MGPMGGPVGAPMPIMNNGNAPPLGPQKNSRTLLNTYIYEYFLRFEMYDCARAVLNSDPQLNVKKDKREIRDENGNITTNGLGDDPMDTDSKDDIDGKRPEDLPAPSLPTSQTDSCFLHEWFCIFWDILNAQKGHSTSAQVKQYVGHTQAQNRARQQAQQELLRNMRTDMTAAHQQQQIIMRGMANGTMNMMGKGTNLQRAAMANNQNPQMQMLAQQQKQGQMVRDPSDMDGSRQRPASPNSTDNAPSPSKRARLDAGPFNPNQPGMLPNGRPAGQVMPGQQVGHGPQQMQQMFLANGVDPTGTTYAQNLQQHHGNQMPNKPMPNAGGPQGQGSPMVPGGPDSTAINAYYNAGEMAGGPGMRPGGGPGGAGAQNRESPNPLSFIGNQMDPNSAPHFYKGMNEMNGNMVAAQMNGMARPPSSHPGQPPFNQMNPQQQQMMAAARQQQLAAQQQQQQQQQAQQQSQQQPGGPGGPPMQWQGGPNGNPMAGGPQGGPQQAGPQGQHVLGTPQQRAAMPPPPTAAANSNANQRNQTASPQVSTAAPPTPQQGNKAAPKKKDSKAKDKKKSNANLNAAAGSTPAPDAPTDGEPPTPATPMTPMASQSFANKAQNAGTTAAPVAQPLPNGQPPAGAPAAAPPVAPPQHADPNQFGMGDMDFGGMEFANPLTSSDVLNDFDFETFLHDSVEENGFDFNPSTFGMEGANEIGAE
ncbi:hypothetical protein MAPG_02755 [Magnaporthiopsis poae ATCC 64411]|uniref:LisH domain-containing protein n=1 Tax=Magnaporthiopsis poae (strain ATCC 64411 / 73-15) TaxID=644358 RepID=A0A0C4DS78_MAGP6|nr:hypothetical protein MAPG_02755 [Magnaporthiopsis poae ATCC 64411]